MEGKTNNNGYKLYRIQWQDHQEAWVPYKCKHWWFADDSEPVQIEDASTPPLPSRAVVNIRRGAVEVYSSPSVNHDPNGYAGLPAIKSLGHLRVNHGYDLTGTLVDQASA